MQTDNINMKIRDLRNLVETRLNDAGVWWVAHPNKSLNKAKGCIQAIRYRNRLGSSNHGGVPLWSELRSQIGYVLQGGEKTYFAVHTRANLKFSETKLSQYFGVKPEQVILTQALAGLIRPEIKKESVLAIDHDKPENSPIFGLVNPFNIDAIFDLCNLDNNINNILQIFDETILLPGGYPDTVTTNIGDRRYAFEIRPNDLIESTRLYFPRTEVLNISTKNTKWCGTGKNKYKKEPEWYNFPPPYGPKIGILTGNSPESGLALWGDILDSFRQSFRKTSESDSKTPDVFMPEFMITSLPQMGLSMELVDREDAVWLHMEKAIKDMLKSGCKIITIACNTTIYFEPKIVEMCQPFNAKFISIAEACMDQINEQLVVTNSEKIGVALIGIGPVIDVLGEFSGYKHHFDAHEIPVTPVNGKDLAYDVKIIGDDPDKIKLLISNFFNTINKAVKNEVVVVLALTEVSMVYREHIERTQKSGSKYVFIDPLHELAKHIVLSYIITGYRQSPVCQIPDNFIIEDYWREKIAQI